jgi:hypothetical protein
MPCRSPWLFAGQIDLPEEVSFVLLVLVLVPDGQRQRSVLVSKSPWEVEDGVRPRRTERLELDRGRLALVSVRKLHNRIGRDQPSVVISILRDQPVSLMHGHFEGRK